MKNPKKILIVSNYDDEMYEQRFLEVPLMAENQAEQLCDMLNDLQQHNPDYYRPVDPDYQIENFEP